MTVLMLYKPDWEQARERLEAWWEGEIVDRAVIQVIARQDSLEPVSSTYDLWWPPLHFLNDPEHVVDTFEEYCRRTYFGGEAFPNLWINLGPGIMAAYMGAAPQFRDDTTWFETPKEWHEIDAIAFDPDNEWWEKTRELTAVAVKRGRGKYLTGLTDIGGNLDLAAALRGSQRLCVDLIDSSDQVKGFAQRINELWFKYYSGFCDILREDMEGTSAWMGIWSPKRWYPLQCDFAAMISQKMFEEFVLPYLEEQCRWLDHAIYHWDGPGQIAHLDLLLEIEELDGIQWVPGAGAEPAASPKWLPLYKKILARGKNLVIEVQPQDVEPLIRELGSRGILLQSTCNTEEEAKLLLERVSEIGIKGAN